MALRELRQPFWPPWPVRTAAKLVRVVGWPEQPARLARRAEDEIADIVGADPALGPSARAFFADAVQHDDDDAWLMAPAPPLPKATRNAMYATLALLLLGTLLIGGQLTYHRLIMPVPAQLGHTHAPRLPSAVTP